MPEPKRPLKVFLCYTHVDRSRVKKKVYDRLVHDGVEVWMDKENLHGGTNWEIEIRKVVRDSDIFIACVSAEFTKQYGLKKFNQTEVGIALQEAQQVVLAGVGIPQMRNIARCLAEKLELENCEIEIGFCFDESQSIFHSIE